MKSVIVLLSGGLDSAVLLWLCKQQFEEVFAISFDYGQRHLVELKYAKELSKIAGVCEHIVVKLPHYSLLSDSSLLNLERDLSQSSEGSVPQTYVPMRNLIFLAIASSFADEKRIENIAIGVHALDSPYPDCRPEFITSAESAINAGSSFVFKTKKRISIFAPFLGMNKGEIVSLGKSLGVPFEKTYSCYAGTEPPCGKCLACTQREKALLEAKITLR